MLRKRRALEVDGRFIAARTIFGRCGMHPIHLHRLSRFKRDMTQQYQEVEAKRNSANAVAAAQTSSAVGAMRGGRRRASILAQR